MKTLRTAISASYLPNDAFTGPWGPQDVDKLDTSYKNFKEVIEACRFFYKKDPIASVTINKLVDLSINELIFVKNGISDNELRIFKAAKEQLKEFAEQMALEFLISGLVAPEWNIGLVDTSDLAEYGIKKKESVYLPTSLWIRDPALIEIKRVGFNDFDSFFIELPPELIQFIQSEGTFSYNEVDKKSYLKLVAEFPELVALVKRGATKIPLDSKYILRRKVVTGSSYPTTYLDPAIDALKHKRNLRRMDYSIAARVIAAIMLIRLGSDEFPVTEQDEDPDTGGPFSDIRSQMAWRNSSNRDMERIFQLFAPHTLQIDWVFPPVEALLDDAKYAEVNKEILTSLGISRTLLVGEAEKTGTSDPELSTTSTIRSMENMRSKILRVLKAIVQDIAEKNKIGTPIIKFKPLNLTLFKEFAVVLSDLYATGNISRESYADFLGYSWQDEVDKKEKEQKILKEKGLGEFAPQAFSPSPTNQNQESKPNNDKTKIPDTEK